MLWFLISSGSLLCCEFQSFSQASQIPAKDIIPAWQWGRCQILVLRAKWGPRERESPVLMTLRPVSRVPVQALVVGPSIQGSVLRLLLATPIPALFGDPMKSDDFR